MPTKFGAPCGRAVALAGALAGASIASAQEAPAAGDARGERPAPLGDRLDALERRNEQLEARLRALEGRDEPGARLDDPANGLEVESADGETKFSGHLFGDYGFRWSNPELAPGEEAAFQFGTLDFFGTARFGDRMSALGEILIEGDQDQVGLDAERLWSQWQFDDALYLKLGLEHLPTARWNRLYHHGKILELTIERPFLARFEDDNGLLPMHFSGLEAGGRALGRCGVLDWTAIVSNGRGPTPDDRQRGGDDNHAKALDVALGVAPTALEGLQFGTMARRDAFPADVANGRTRSEGEWTAGTWVQLDRGAFTSIAEATALWHRDRAAGDGYRHHAAYVQAGWRIDRVTPYARYDVISMQRGDPYYAPVDGDLDRVEATVGVRFDLLPNAALKLELRRGSFEQRGSGGRTDRQGVTTAAFQLSWYL